MPEVRLGIPSVVEAALLPRLMGSGRAAWLVLTGEAIDARRALSGAWSRKSQPDVDLALEKLVEVSRPARRERCASRNGCCSSGTRRRSRPRWRRASKRFRRTTISSTEQRVVGRNTATRSMATKQAVYDASAITALKGLEPVRRMPGMYTHTVHPLHIVQEAIDNAVDEALAGFGKKITVALRKDGSVEVSRRRPRHAGRHAPGGEEAGGRGGVHHAARRRQVLALGRRRVPHLRRPARRRRGGVERAFQALRGRRFRGTTKSTPSRSKAASSSRS